MNKLHFQIIPVMLSVLTFSLSIFTSCSNEDFGLQDNTKDSPITVTAGVDGMNTRAGYDATTNLPAKFYLTITQEDGDSEYNYTDVKMTKGDGNDYTPEKSLLWKGYNHSANAINAYTIKGTAFTVQTDQSTADKVVDSDLLGAIKATENSDIAISQDNIGITFRHLLCKLDVTYTWGADLQKETIKSKRINSVIYKGFGTKVTLNRETAAVTNGSDTADIKAYVDSEKSEAIFAPYCGNTPQICIIIETTTGEDEEAVTEERSFVFDVTAPTSGFTSGNSYTMNVTIGETTVEDKSVTATVAGRFSGNKSN